MEQVAGFAVADDRQGRFAVLGLGVAGYLDLPVPAGPGQPAPKHLNRELALAQRDHLGANLAVSAANDVFIDYLTFVFALDQIIWSRLLRIGEDPLGLLFVLILFLVLIFLLLGLVFVLLFVFFLGQKIHVGGLPGADDDLAGFLDLLAIGRLPASAELVTVLVARLERRGDEAADGPALHRRHAVEEQLVVRRQAHLDVRGDRPLVSLLLVALRFFPGFTGHSEGSEKQTQQQQTSHGAAPFAASVHGSKLPPIIKDSAAGC